MKKSSRLLYYSKLIGVFVIAAVALATGSCVVTVNCHNAVSADQMVGFDLCICENGYKVTLLDEEYYIPI